MTIVTVFAVWSCFAIPLWLAAGKYHWLRPPWAQLALFAFAGICSCLPSLLVNQFLGRETELWPFSDDPFYSFLGFAIGAGLSEELWKMLAGVAAVLLLRALPGRRLYAADHLAGFIVVGLGFAAFENLFAYNTSDPGLMFLRSMFAVPLHGCMGAVHGVTFNAAARRGSAWPMVLGWLVAAAAHTWYDTWNLFLPNASIMAVQLPTVGITCFLTYLAWRLTPEIPNELTQTAQPH